MEFVNKLLDFFGPGPMQLGKGVSGARDYKIYAAEERAMGKEPLSPEDWAKKFR